MLFLFAIYRYWLLLLFFRILLRVCQTLKSRARDVRDTARETLVNIASSLGPEYFPFVLKEMKSVLQRGYQVDTFACLVELVESSPPNLFVLLQLLLCCLAIAGFNRIYINCQFFPL